MTDGFDDDHDRIGDTVFFAGIGAEDVEEQLDVDEDALLARTKVLPAEDEPTGTGMTPFLAAGAGGVGAAGLGSYAGGTRADDRSRSGASAPVAGPLGVPVGAHEDDPAWPHGGHIGADGRVRPDDPWGLGDDDHLPGATSTAATDAAPRLRGTSGTRGSHLSRGESGSTAPTATLGGFGGMPLTGGAAAATQTAGGTPGGGIPLSVLQNLQSGRASGAAFSPMSTGVSAAGAGVHPGDPAVLYAQALAASDVGGVPAGGSQWLDDQLRRRTGIEVDVDGGAADTEPDPESDDDADGDRRRTWPATAAAGGIVAGVGAGLWGGGGTAPRDPSSGGDVASPPGSTAETRDPAVPIDRDWGWDPTPVHAAPPRFTGTPAETGVAPAASTGFTPTAPAGPSAGHDAPPASEAPVVGAPAAPSTHAPRPGGGGATGPRPGAAPTAGGTDFTVSGDALSEDAEHWRRLSGEMELVRSAVMGMRDGRSSFGLVSEPAGAYTAATDQVQRWTRQGASAYEQLAAQLGATARSYDANERNAIGSTGRVFEL